MQALLWTILISVLLTQTSGGRLLVQQCGIPPMTSRIMHGHNANEEASAWMAGIRNKTDFQCGGTVIHRRFVLTAAHCIVDQDSLFVVLGAYNLSRPALTYSVSKGIVHHGFSRHTFQHDIGLLQLTHLIQFNADVYPICIVMGPDFKSKVEQVNTFDAYGWGKTHRTNISELLQEVTLYRRDRSVCEGYVYLPITTNQICAGSSHGDTCSGDSGGPLTKKVTTKDILRQAQLGIVSYGQTKCNGEGVYTDVSSYADWIEEKVNQYQSTHTEGYAGFSGIESSEPDSASRPPPEFATNPPPLEADSRQRPPPGFATYPSPHIPYRGNSRRPLSQTQGGTKFLDSECGGDNIAMNLLVKIYGMNYEGNGVMITDRYVLTTARDLSSDAGSLEVAIAGSSPYEELRVESVVKHPDYSDDYAHDIALLKLTQAVSLSGPKKPICMLLNASHREEASLDKRLTIFDYRGSGIYPLVIKSINSRECSTRIDRQIEQDQLCIEERSNMTKLYGQTGHILGAQMTYSSKNRYILFGIVSYSSNGLHILTNVMKYTDWITDVVMNG